MTVLTIRMSDSYVLRRKRSIMVTPDAMTCLRQLIVYRSSYRLLSLIRYSELLKIPVTILGLVMVKLGQTFWSADHIDYLNHSIMRVLRIYPMQSVSLWVLTRREQCLTYVTILFSSIFVFQYMVEESDIHVMKCLEMISLSFQKRLPTVIFL